MTVDEKQAVNRPEHYQGKHECIEVMRAMFGDEAVVAFCRCNSFKYRFRAGTKTAMPANRISQRLNGMRTIS